MDLWRNVLALSLTAALAAGVLGPAAAASGPKDDTKVYRWTDEKGVVHYGDSVPEEDSQKAREILNGQGVQIGHVEGARSAEAEAAAEQAAAEAQQRAQHDKFLLATYLSTRDIEQLRDERVGLVESQIKAGMAYIDTIDARLASLSQRAVRFRPYNSEPGARRMPDDLAESLVHTLNELRTQRQVLEAKRQEQNDLQKQFDNDIHRYRELTAHRTGAGH